MSYWNRREFLGAGLSTAALASAPHQLLRAAPAATATDKPFQQRGYYITFMRGPLFSFDVWKNILDDVRDDGGNMVILWMGGAFRSRNFPITWRYNEEHENVKHNFAGALIDYAHSLGLKALLCLTPYAYDGTNQYAIDHPELKGIQQNGNYAKASGLDAWGFNLNPWRPEAEQFMLDYTRELLDFYPNADGLLIESSDYAISYCGQCPESYYQREFAYVRKISDEIWARKPDATIIVYPHYFNSAPVPGMKATGAAEPFDERWTLFFTPHSAYLDPALIKRARSSIYWDPSPTFGRPRLIREAARKARAAGVTGFVPSLEPWNYRFSGPDMGAQFLVGTRCSPFGQAWLKPGELPTRTLLMRLDRLAYREFSQNPGLDMPQFQTLVGQEIFKESATADLVEDLLFVDDSFFLDRTWDSTCAICSPDYVKGRLGLGQMSPEQLRDYRDRRRRLAAIAKRRAHAADAATTELAGIASWIITNWDASPNRHILEDHLR